MAELSSLAHFDWDELNIEHIARHNVLPHEAEEVIQNNPLDLSIVLRSGERRTEQIGETNASRVLRVISTMRDGKVRVVTAIPLRRRWHPWYFALKEQQNA